MANLPYHITSPILHRLLGEPPRPRRLVLMVQREVAERIAARPGGLSYLSVFVQYHAAVRIARRVPPTAFEPAPAVDSAIIVLEPFAEDDRLEAAAEDALWRLVQAAFRERRKMIHNVLARQLPLPAERVAAALAAAGIESDRRPQTLAVGEWLRLLETIGPIGAGRARAGGPMIEPGRRLGPVIRLAPAKLNLTLAIVGRRPDGFHALHSVMAPLGLADRLSLALAAGGEDTLFVVNGAAGDAERASLGATADNLVLRAIAAARAGARAAGVPPPALAARLEKRIPVAAGLAGGSSDAAAALDGALEAWGAGGTSVLSAEERLRIAARLGSDVPFFLAGGLALVEGRGERVSPLPGAIRGEPPGVLLIVPRIAVPTPAVFAAYAASGVPINGATRLTSDHLAGELQRGLTARALHDRAAILASANDLAAASASVAPAIVPFRRALARLTGRPIGLSGSGPSLWILYPSLETARAAEAEVRRALDDGSLVAPGEGRPFVAATPIAADRVPR